MFPTERIHLSEYYLPILLINRCVLKTVSIGLVRFVLSGRSHQ